MRHGRRGGGDWRSGGRRRLYGRWTRRGFGRLRRRRAGRDEAPGDQPHDRRGQHAATAEDRDTAPPGRGRFIGFGPEAVQDVLHEWPRVGLAIESLGDDGVHRGRHATAPRAHRQRCPGHLSVANRLARRPLEGEDARQHLVEDDRERVDVGLFGQGTPVNQLGRQVFGRGFAAGSAEQGRQVTQAGQLDVEELGLAVLKHHHVARAQYPPLGQARPVRLRRFCAD